MGAGLNEMGSKQYYIRILWLLTVADPFYKVLESAIE